MGAKKIIIFGLLIAAAFPRLFAEHDVSLRLGAGVKAPLGLPQFGAGVGGEASLDWAFLNFAGRFDLGVSAGGGFANIPVQVGDPLALLEGRAGPFLRWRPLDRLSFQAGPSAGVYRHSGGEDAGTGGLFSVAFGGDFRLMPYFSLFAGGVYIHRVFDANRPLSTFGASAGIRLNLSEIMGGRARVRIEPTRQYRIFPVSWAWYEHNPVAMVRITNEEPNAITDLSLSFFMDSYMTQPWTFAVLPRLAPGESVELPMTALFNEAMMTLNENVNAHGLIRMQYRSLGAQRVTSSSVQMPIFHRNAFSWDDDRRAAAFVSPNDFAARFFARYVAAAVSSGGLAAERDTPRNVLYAVALFEALRLYGISYVIDPASSFVLMSADAAALDSLNFPYQTLRFRGGDCDDLSILFCSLLEVLGIETAFITVPGHIYAAFDVGDDYWQTGNGDIIEIAGRRWLPVEITVPDQGFARAWRIGALQWARYGDEAELLPVREAWVLYPSVTVPGSGGQLLEMPGWGEIIRATQSQLATIDP